MKRTGRADATRMFERDLSSQNSQQPYLLRLFVTGSTPRSARAIQNIRAICEERLEGRYVLEVIDIYQHPEEVGPDQIVVIPTLVKKLPEPVRKIIGDLSDKERVLAGLAVITP
jgi:circadian clock protein KaiB